MYVKTAGRFTARGLGCLVLGLVACLSGAVAQQAGRGEAVYAANGCFQCHGYEGQGGAAGPRIAPSPYPYEAFAQLVRRPVDVMPAYAASFLSDADLREIFGYVRSIPEPPEIDDIPVLR